MFPGYFSLVLVIFTEWQVQAIPFLAEPEYETDNTKDANVDYTFQDQEQNYPESIENSPVKNVRPEDYSDYNSHQYITPQAIVGEFEKFDGKSDNPAQITEDLSDVGLCTNPMPNNQQYATQLDPYQHTSIPTDSIMNDVKIAGDKKSKRKVTVYSGEDVTICWTETTIIKEDQSTANYRNRQVIREYSISFENSVTIPSNDLICPKIGKREIFGIREEICNTSFIEGISQNTRTSRPVALQSFRVDGNIGITESHIIKCSVGSVVTKDILKGSNGAKSSIKKMEIKVSPTTYKVHDYCNSDHQHQTKDILNSKSTTESATTQRPKGSHESESDEILSTGIDKNPLETSVYRTGSTVTPQIIELVKSKEPSTTEESMKGSESGKILSTSVTQDVLEISTVGRDLISTSQSPDKKDKSKIILPTVERPKELQKSESDEILSTDFIPEPSTIENDLKPQDPRTNGRVKVESTTTRPKGSQKSENQGISSKEILNSSITSEIDVTTVQMDKIKNILDEIPVDNEKYETENPTFTTEMSLGGMLRKPKKPIKSKDVNVTDLADEKNLKSTTESEIVASSTLKSSILNLETTSALSFGISSDELSTKSPIADDNLVKLKDRPLHNVPMIKNVADKSEDCSESKEKVNITIPEICSNESGNCEKTNVTLPSSTISANLEENNSDSQTNDSTIKSEECDDTSEVTISESDQVNDFKNEKSTTTQSPGLDDGDMSTTNLVAKDIVHTTETIDIFKESPKPKDKNKLALKIRVSLEHIGEDKTQHKIADIEKDLTLSGNSDDSKNDILVKHLQALNNTENNFDSFRRLLNCSILDEIADNIVSEKNEHTHIPHSNVTRKTKHHGRKSHRMHEKRSVDTDINDKQNSSSTKTKKIEECLLEIHDDIKTGLNTLVSEISNNNTLKELLNTVKSSNNTSETGDSKMSERIKRFAHTGHPNEIIRWTNERFIDLNKGNQLHSITELILLDNSEEF